MYFPNCPLKPVIQKYNLISIVQKVINSFPLFPDDGQKKVNLGQFSQSPAFDQDGLITLTYTDGSACLATGMKTSTVITFVCAPGNILYFCLS